MSQAQEDRTHRLVAEWQAELKKLSAEIDTPKEQVEAKEQKIAQLMSQIDSAMRSNSY